MIEEPGTARPPARADEASWTQVKPLHGPPGWIRPAEPADINRPQLSINPNPKMAKSHLPSSLEVKI